MGICGGICFLGIYLFETLYGDIHILFKCLFGCSFITLNEFLTGCIVNLWLGWNVWDYSDLNFDLLGQICLLYSGFWFLLCIPVFSIAHIFRNKLFFPKKDCNNPKEAV